MRNIYLVSPILERNAWILPLAVSFFVFVTGIVIAFIIYNKKINKK